MFRGQGEGRRIGGEYLIPHGGAGSALPHHLPEGFIIFNAISRLSERKNMKTRVPKS